MPRPVFAVSVVSRFGRCEREDDGAGGTSLRSGAVLSRPSARPLVRHDPPAIEDLAAPDPGGLLALNRAGQAVAQNRAAGTEFLRPLELPRFVGEPKLRIVYLAGQPGLSAPGDGINQRAAVRRQKPRPHTGARGPIASEDPRSPGDCSAAPDVRGVLRQLAVVIHEIALLARRRGVMSPLRCTQRRHPDECRAWSRPVRCAVDAMPCGRAERGELRALGRRDADRLPGRRRRNG